MSSVTTWPDIIADLLEGRELSVSDAGWAMEQIVSGATSDARLAAFLVALRAKGATVGEIVGFRDAALARAEALDVSPWAVDIVGTGGDGAQTVNVSTMASIVIASTGIPVIKHGNRAASSRSGSSDVLGALGLPADVSPTRVAEVFAEVGITFVNAAQFHPGFKHAASVRAELGVPTVFNFLGPLCNPARPEASAIGVANPDVVPLIVGVMQTRGATALVFRGDDGLDELTTTGHSRIWEVSRGSVTEHDLDPSDVGIARATLDDLVGGTPVENAVIARHVLAGESGPVRDIVELNAAAGIAAYELARDAARAREPLRDRLRAGIERARVAIDRGDATRTLDAWIAAAHR